MKCNLKVCAILLGQYGMMGTDAQSLLGAKTSALPAVAKKRERHLLHDNGLVLP